MRALRILGAAVFIAIGISVLGSIHYYLAKRLILDAELPAPAEQLGVALLLALMASVVTLPIAERVLRPAAARVIAWPASIWMGLMFLLFCAVAVSDLALWAAGTPAIAGIPAIAGTEGDALGPSRTRAAAVTVLALGAGVFALVTALRGPLHTPVEIRISGWPVGLDGFRIVQLSDIHIGPILDNRFARELARRTNALEPDLIALTGDLVDGNVDHLRDEIAPFGDLRAPHGVYFVTGNHDHYSGAPGWVEAVDKLGIRVLRNERVTIERDGACFELAGVDDHQGTFEPGWREDLPKALDGVDPERALVLLAHDPRTFKKASTLGVDLQLSGHTHGGQIWPFRYFVRLATRWVSGLYREGDAQIYVSRGTGFWGPPMRLFAPAEITDITIRPA